jgi:hypothetical protein
MLLAVYTVFHFCKQQAAWFFIASSKDKLKKTKYENVIDKLTIYLSVAGPALISMCSIVGKKGWRISTDLPNLPDQVIHIVFYSWIIVMIQYLCIQCIKYKKKSYVTWGKHFHLINGLFIWVMYRLEPIDSIAFIGALLLMYGHSIPYIYLGQRYMKDRIENGEKYYLPLPSKKFLFIALATFGIAAAYSEVKLVNIFWITNSEIVKSIILTCVFTHYFFDGFLWKKQYHPEGLAFIKVNE